ncbi:MAG: carboxypeptidase regulatory-like domain-containing protein [Promethearchaeota archaeon]
MKSKKTKFNKILGILLIVTIFVPLFVIPTNNLINPDVTTNNPSQLEVKATVIKVHVMDKLTGNEISGAYVEYTPVIAGTYEDGYTNPSGRFNPGSCDPGTYNITIYMPGYKLYIKYPVILQSDETKFFDIYLERDEDAPPIWGWIEVNVFYLASPESGVTVQCINSSGLVTSGATDGSGFFNITDLEVGTYNVTVSKTGYYTQSKGAVINWMGDNESLTFNLEATPTDPGWIEITVRDNESNPLENALIQVINATSQALVVLGYTDVSGFFNATGLGIGWYNVTASKDGYIPETQDDYIGSAGEKDIMNFYLIPYGPNSAFIEVTVKDSNTSTVISGVYVTIIYSDSGDNVSTGLTDVNGQINATNLQIGWYDIYANKTGYAPTRVSNEISFNGEGDRIVIYLAPADPISLTVTVHVRDADLPSMLITNALVNFQQYGSTVGETNTFNYGFATSENILNTTCLITVSKAGYNTNATLFNFSGYNSPDYVNVFVFLKTKAPSSGVIHIYVKDIITNDPLENASLTLKCSNGSTIDLGKTPSNGYLNVTGLDKGDYTVNVTRDFYYSKEMPTTIDADGDVDTVEILLVRIEFISLRLILKPITPNPDPTGDIDLEWNYIGLAEYYMVYRGSQAGNLSFYKNITDISIITYKDIGVTGFYYYYQIYASNGTHIIISNVERVGVYKGGNNLHPGWILICIGAVAAGALGLYVIIVDEMRRDYEKEKQKKGEKYESKGG